MHDSTDSNSLAEDSAYAILGVSSSATDAEIKKVRNATNGAKGIAASNKGILLVSRMLLVAPGITTRNKKLLGTRA